MRFGTLHRASLTAAAALPVIGVMGGSTLLTASGAVLLILLVVRGGNLFDLPRSRPFTIVVHGLTILILIFAILLFPRARIDAVLLVVMLGIFNRWLLRSGHRDDLIVLGAAAVLLAAATTITPGIAFAVIIVAFLVASLWAAFSGLILSMAEREPSDEARRATWLRLARRPAGRLLGPIAVLSIVFMLIGASVMLLFPRYNFSQLLSAGYFMSLSGQTDEMELRTTGVPSPGGGWVAMRVEPTPGRPPGSLDAMYASMSVLDEFDGRTWRSHVKDPRRELYLYHPSNLYQGPKEAFAPDVDGPSMLRVTLFRRVPQDQPHPVAALGRDRPGFVAMYAVRQLDNGSVIRGPRWPGTQLVYKVDPDRSVPTFPLPDQARFLQLPDGLDPRVVDLAARLTAGKTTERDKALAIVAHFSHGYTYSLEPLEGASNDPLVRFLFEAKSGHCELYAGALAVLLRLAGVKARVVTGYYGGWWNSVGGYLELGDSDAHAWVEAYYDGAWRWLDATPESQRARRTQKSFVWILDTYDALEAFWHDNVVAFDERQRREMMGRLAQDLEGLTALSWLGGADPTSSGATTGRSASRLALPVVVFLALAAVPVLWWWRRRNLRPEILGLRLRKALGGPRNATLGRTLAGVSVELQPLAREAIRTYERHRFGPEDGAPDASVVAAAIRALERAS